LAAARINLPALEVINNPSLIFCFSTQPLQLMKTLAEFASKFFLLLVSALKKAPVSSE
jgi:hypothetical protein